MQCIKEIGMHRCVGGREEEGVVGCKREHKDEMSGPVGGQMAYVRIDG